MGTGICYCRKLEIFINKILTRLVVYKLRFYIDSVMVLTAFSLASVFERKSRGVFRTLPKV